MVRRTLLALAVAAALLVAGPPASRADTLSPQSRIASGVGPTKPSLHLRQISAKCAFSERKPYPGWMASAPVISAAAMICGMLR